MSEFNFYDWLRDGRPNRVLEDYKRSQNSMSKTGYEQHIKGNDVFYCSMTDEQKKEYNADCQAKRAGRPKGKQIDPNYEARLAMIDNSANPYGTRRERDWFENQVSYRFG